MFGLQRDRSKCDGVFRKFSVVSTWIQVWLATHMEEWVSALPSSDEARITAEKDLEDAEAALEAATQDYSRHAAWAHEDNFIPSVITAELAAKAEKVTEAEAVREDALAAVGNLAPPQDKHDALVGRIQGNGIQDRR